MGNTTLMTVNTNSKGVAAFNVAPDGSVVTCAAGGFTSADGVIYRPSTGALGTSQSTTAGTTGNGTTGDKPGHHGPGPSPKAHHDHGGPHDHGQDLRHHHGGGHHGRGRGRYRARRHL